MYVQNSVGSESYNTHPVHRFDGLYLAQVVGIAPEHHAVNILLPALSGMTNAMKPSNLNARVLEHRAGMYVGELDLPRIGDWGVVAFPHGSDHFAVWLGSLYQDFNHIATSHREERISHHDSGVYSRIAQDGTVEWSHPSGTFLKIGSETTLSPRTRFQRQGANPKPQEVDYAIPTKPAPTVHVEHTSGLTLTISPSGNLTINVPGHETTTVVGNEDHTVKGNLTIVGEQNVVICGDDVTIKSTHADPGAHLHFGGETGEDFIALKAALDHILSVFNSHTHPGTGTPDQSINFVQDTHYTGQSKAT